MSFKLLFLHILFLAIWALDSRFLEKKRIWRRYQKNINNHERANRQELARINSTFVDMTRDVTLRPAMNAKKENKYDIQNELWPEMAKLKENRKKWAYDAGPKFGYTKAKRNAFYQQMHISRWGWGSSEAGKFK